MEPDLVSGNPEVIKEARKKKRGGKVVRKDGGKVARKAGGKIEPIGLMTGGAVRPRLDRPGRQLGGRVGADKSPLSTAHPTVKPQSDGETKGGSPD